MIDYSYYLNKLIINFVTIKIKAKLLNETKMKIFVKNPYNDKIFPLEVEPDATTETIKEMIERETTIPAIGQVLIFDKKKISES